MFHYTLYNDLLDAYSCYIFMTCYIIFIIILAFSDGRWAGRTTITIGSSGGTGAGLAGPCLLLENPDNNKEDTHTCRRGR